MKNSSHLTDQHVKHLLDNEPSPENLAILGDHLESCAACQVKLELAAADSWWWNEGQHVLFETLCNLKSNETNTSHEQIQSPSYNPVKAEVEAIVETFGTPVHPELLGQVEEFEIERLIGIGGMGIVFKGFDRELNRPIAIKFLSPRLASTGTSRQRFAREAKAVAAICHDNVIPVFRINSKWQYPFFVMPLIAGVSLEQLVHLEGTLEPNQLVQIATQIAAGLAAAHEKGLIHRDIKPANILLQNNCNRVVITDFGLAQDESDVSLTQTGSISGTPQYMSPEQSEGKQLDACSDLFSLGGVMYWMATAQPPFQGRGQYELLTNIRNDELRSPREFNPAIPVQLERAIEKLLSKQANDRFQSAEELESFLNQYTAYLCNPTSNREPRLARKVQINWRWSAAIALGTIGLIALLTMLPSLWERSPWRKTKLADPVNQPGTMFVAIMETPVALGDSEKEAIRSVADLNPEKLKFDKCRAIMSVVRLPGQGQLRLNELTRPKFVHLAQQNPSSAFALLDQWILGIRNQGDESNRFVLEPGLVAAEVHMSLGQWESAGSELRQLQSLFSRTDFEVQEKFAALVSLCELRERDSGRLDVDALQNTQIENTEDTYLQSTLDQLFSDLETMLHEAESLSEN